MYVYTKLYGIQTTQRHMYLEMCLWVPLLSVDEAGELDKTNDIIIIIIILSKNLQKYT